MRGSVSGHQGFAYGVNWSRKWTFLCLFTSLCTLYLTLKSGIIIYSIQHQSVRREKTQFSFLWRIHFQGLFLLLTHSSFFSGKLGKNKVDLFGSIPTFLVGHKDRGIKVLRVLPGQLPPRETVPKPRLPAAQEHIRLILESVHRAIWRYIYRYTVNSAVVSNEGCLFISHMPAYLPFFLLCS